MAAIVKQFVICHEMDRRKKITDSPLFFRENKMRSRQIKICGILFRLPFAVTLPEYPFNSFFSVCIYMASSIALKDKVKKEVF